MVKIMIDQKNCIGCGSCENVCPEFFQIDQSGSEFKAKIKTDLRLREIGFGKFNGKSLDIMWRSFRKEEDRVKFAVAGYLGVPKRLRSEKIKSWKNGVKSINYWPKDKYGTNAKIYVSKVMKNYDKYSREGNNIKIARLNY